MPSGKQFFISWRRTAGVLLPSVALAAYALLLCLVECRHEMWRDEIQAWLLARDSSSLMELSARMHYEGHPMLWHALLWPLAHATWNPVAMQVLHCLLAMTAAGLVLFLSPFPFVMRLFLVFGYLFFYEWGVIARNYAVGVLLLLSFCAFFRHRWKGAPWLALLLACACHSCVHCLILVICLIPWLVYLWIRENWGASRGPSAYGRRALVGLCVVLLGIGTSIAQLRLAEDVSEPIWRWSWNRGTAESVVAIVTYGYLPTPPPTVEFWGRNELMECIRKFWSPKWMAAEAWVSVGLVILGCALLLPRASLLVLYLCGTSALLLFFYVKHFGSIRHHGFTFLWLVVLLWLAAQVPRRLFRATRLETTARLWEKAGIWLLTPVLAAQVYGACMAVGQEWTHLFSNGKAAALWLRSEVGRLGGGAASAIAGDNCPIISTVVGYGQFERVYYLDRGVEGTFCVWVKKLLSLPRLSSLGHRTAAWMESKEVGTILFLVTTGPVDEKWDGPRLIPLASFATNSISGESYYIYRIECGANDP